MEFVGRPFGRRQFGRRQFGRRQFVRSHVAGRATIAIDGGFSRGTDIVKAIALGADIVGIGRAYCYGLAAAGSEGIVRVLELLEEEIRSNGHLEYAPDLGRIKVSGTHLLNLISEILDFNKIESGKMTISSELCSPATIVEEVAGGRVTAQARTPPRQARMASAAAMAIPRRRENERVGVCGRTRVTAVSRACGAVTDCGCCRRTIERRIDRACGNDCADCPRREPELASAAL